MNTSFQPQIMTLGLFEKRIEGDDCLMELARRRFQQVGMGAEMHAVTPEQLVGLMKFRPSENSPMVVHLARDLNLVEPGSQGRILEFASRFAGRVYGLVLHDHASLALRSEEYLRAAQEMESRLEKIAHCPMLFIEYAAGLDLGTFTAFFRSIRDLSRVSACIDIGHVGIRHARDIYSKTHPGEDICALKTQTARIPETMPALQAAVNSAPAAVLELVQALGALGKPLHFHLHDGHPLSTFSSFGVSDHLSFLTEIPLQFEYLGKRSAPLMFGPNGLSRILGQAIAAIEGEGISFTLEIHPTADRLPLGDQALFFGHWRDKTNAERMNHWLSVAKSESQLIDGWDQSSVTSRGSRGHEEA